MPLITIVSLRRNFSGDSGCWANFDFAATSVCWTPVAVPENSRAFFCRICRMAASLASTFPATWCCMHGRIFSRILAIGYGLWPLTWSRFRSGIALTESSALRRFTGYWITMHYSAICMRSCVRQAGCMRNAAAALILLVSANGCGLFHRRLSSQTGWKSFLSRGFSPTLKARLLVCVPLDSRMSKPASKRLPSLRPALSNFSSIYARSYCIGTWSFFPGTVFAQCSWRNSPRPRPTTIRRGRWITGDSIFARVNLSSAGA